MDCLDNSGNDLQKRAATNDVTAHIFTPRIHVRITCEVRASLAGISALPKVHLAHVLLPRREDMKILNNNICPSERSIQAGVNMQKAIIQWVKGEVVDPSMLVLEYDRMFAKNDYLVEVGK